MPTTAGTIFTEIRKKNWQKPKAYGALFCASSNGPFQSAKVDNLLSKLPTMCLDFRILGVWKSTEKKTFFSNIFYITLFLDQIPQLTDSFRKLNIGGAACLLDKILLKKRTLDFSTWLYKKCSLILKIANAIRKSKLIKYLEISSRLKYFWPSEHSRIILICLIFLPSFTS